MVPRNSSPPDNELQRRSLKNNVNVFRILASIVTAAAML